MNMLITKDINRGYIKTCILYLIIYSLLYITMLGCGGISSELDLPTESKGYVLYVFAKKTEIMIDFSKKDGISRGTKLDVFRMAVPNMEGPVKIGEVVVEKVGGDMSKAKVTAITSSLSMERGDRVFPHPVIIATDDSWITSRTPSEGWSHDLSLSEERLWEACEVLSADRVRVEPEIRQLTTDTDAKPVWHPSVKARTGDVYFRKVFVLDADPSNATLSIICGGRTSIYMNGKWIGTAKEWPEVNHFKVHAYLDDGRNLVAVKVNREPRVEAPPALFLAITVETEFK